MRGIELLHPEMRVKAEELQTLCRIQGLALLITETWRTMAEQDALYAQGRTKPGSIVTNCKGSDYQSPHQWGVAFDFCKNIKGQEYSDTAFFRQVGALGKSIGLRWGGDFQKMVDMPHFQLNNLLLGSDFTTGLKNKYGTPEKYRTSWPADVVAPEPEPTPAEPAPTPLDNTPGGHAAEAIEWAINNDLLRGNERGDFRLHALRNTQDIYVILHRYDKMKEGKS